MGSHYKYAIPGFGVPVSYHGYVVTVEDLGNYTYGYLGAAFGIPYEVLITGSYAAAGFPSSPKDVHNEVGDCYLLYQL